MATDRSRRRSDETPAARAPGKRRAVWRNVGLGLITGAADDDPSALGTYSAAGARFGLALLWTAPVTFPMMFVAVYLSAKVGQVAGEGLFRVIRARFPRWVLYSALATVLVGNVIEAGADLGGIAAAVGLLIHVKPAWILVTTAAIILALQVWGSYTLIRNVFRILAMTLLAYVAAALLARPNAVDVLRHTFVPTFRFDREFLTILVAILGTTLSAYLYTWQSNEEVEEEIAMGRTRLKDRRGASDAELAKSRWDVGIGMAFSNLIMYFVILATGSTLFRAGSTGIETAAQAAAALKPLAGEGASVLFAVGMIGVGFLAVPVMTAGAAYDISQSLGWKHSLHAKPRRAPRFYVTIGALTALAVAFNFLRVNPMRALVVAGVVQGFSIPGLLYLILRITNDRRVMGRHANGRALNVLGYATLAVSGAAVVGLVASWFL